MKKENIFYFVAILSCLAMVCVTFITNINLELILKLINKIPTTTQSIDVINQIKDNQTFIFNSLLTIIGFFITIVLFFLGFTLIYNKDFEKRVAENIKDLEASLADLKKMTSVNKYFQELMRVQCYSECKTTRLNTLRNKERQLKKQYSIKDFESNNEINEKFGLLLNFKAIALLENLNFERALEKYDELLNLSSGEEKGRIYYRKAHVKTLIFQNKYDKIFNNKKFDDKLDDELTKKINKKLDEVIKLCNNAISSNEKFLAAYHLKGTIYYIKASLGIQKDIFLEIAQTNIEKVLELELYDAKGLYYEIKFQMLKDKENEYQSILQLCEQEIAKSTDDIVTKNLKETKEKILLFMNESDNYSNKYGNILEFSNITIEQKKVYLKNKFLYLFKNELLQSKEFLDECDFLINHTNKTSFNEIGYYLILKSIIFKNLQNFNEAIKTCCIGIKKCKIELNLATDKDYIYDSLGLGFYIKGELSEFLSGGNPKKCYTISSHYYKKITKNIGEEKEVYQKKCEDKIKLYTNIS